MANGEIGTAKEAAFDKALQDHYGGMYDKIKQANAADKIRSASPVSDASSEGRDFVPADIPIFAAPKAADGSQKAKKKPGHESIS